MVTAMVNQIRNPFELFRSWLTLAQANGNIKEPTAMSLATYSPSLGLQNRIVLMKDYSDHGLTFFTNYLSPKGQSLKENPIAAATFYWDPLGRQVRFRGSITLTDRKTSENYWSTRPRESQLSGFISKQSQTVDSRETLQKLVEHADAEFKDRSIPCPEHWGGYHLNVDSVEFWEGKVGRLHDRWLYNKTDSGWSIQRLYP